MNKAIFSLTVSLILRAAVIVTTPITIMENAFAKSGTGRHTGGSVAQATSISNSCLNPESNSNTNDNMISNGNCGGTISQQGRSGQASTPTTVQSANPNIEVQRSTTPGLGATPPTTGTLTIKSACDSSITPNNSGACPLALEIGFFVMDSANKVYTLTFFGGGSGPQSQSININPGEFQIESQPGPSNVVVSYSGGCMGGQPSNGQAGGDGGGTIGAG